MLNLLDAIKDKAEEEKLLNHANFDDFLESLEEKPEEYNPCF